MLHCVIDSDHFIINRYSFIISLVLISFSHITDKQKSLIERCRQQVFHFGSFTRVFTHISPMLHPRMYIENEQMIQRAIKRKECGDVSTVQSFGGLYRENEDHSLANAAKHLTHSLI